MKLLALSLSLRKASVNTTLLTQAITSAKRLDVEVEKIDLRDFQMPYYDGDMESSPSGVPENAKRLAAMIASAKGLIISSPEYNFSMPGHFKNTFDWLSRVKPSPFSRRCVLLMSASPSLVGGNRGLWSLRIPFEACGSFVYPDMFSLAQANDAFTADGLKDPALAKRLTTTVESFVRFAKGFEA